MVSKYFSNNTCMIGDGIDDYIGNFDHRRKAWLVIWEAGVIIEIPAGVFIAYPSSLFYHFNWDIGEHVHEFLNPSHTLMYVLKRW